MSDSIYQSPRLTPEGSAAGIRPIETLHIRWRRWSEAGINLLVMAVMPDMNTEADALMVNSTIKKMA